MTPKKSVPKFKNFLKFYFKVKFLVSYRYGTIFREAVNIPPIEWCDMMDKPISNPFVKMMVDAVKGTAPHLFHACPYNVSLSFNNAYFLIVVACRNFSI